MTSARALTRIGATPRNVPTLQDASQAPQTVSALPAKVDLNIYQGDYFALDVLVTNPDGTPTDVSSAAARAQIRSTPSDPEILATFAISYDLGITGLLHLLLDETETAPLPPKAAWDLQLSVPVVTTIAAGVVTVAREVTRP